MLGCVKRLIVIERTVHIKPCHNRLPNVFYRLCLLQFPAFMALFWCLPVFFPLPSLTLESDT